MKRLLLLTTCLFALAAHAQQVPAPETEDEQAIQPQLDRPDIVVPAIDTENFELTAYAGLLSLDHFATEPVLGLRTAYHLSEDFFVEASLGRSRISDTAFRRLGFLPLFDDENEPLRYYHLSLGYNALPAELFAGASRAYNGGVYVIAGVGNTEFAGENYFTYNLGGGLRLLPNDWLVLRTELRWYAFEWSLLGEHELGQHLEATANVGVFF